MKSPSYTYVLNILGIHNIISLFVMIRCTYEVINLNSFLDIGFECSHGSKDFRNDLHHPKSPKKIHLLNFQSNICLCIHILWKLYTIMMTIQEKIKVQPK